ncbi:MAG: maltokinase N-terminal cap-like domain-containing protein [Aeromicrobium sp.]
MNARLDYLSRQRWFAGGDDVTLSGVDACGWIREPTDGFGVRLEFVNVLVDGVEQTYNMPTSYRTDPHEGFEGALIEHDGDYFVYDALHDAHARTELLSGFFGAALDGLTFSGTLPVDADAPTIELIAEQSNTSIIIGNDLVLKLFRKVVHGRNPEIELSRALTEDGSTQVAAVHGWITLRDVGQGDVDLAMVSDFIRSATTGWDSARASFRDLVADPDADASEAGGDFAGESERLGETVADIHRRLASLFGTESWGPAELSALADRLDERCRAASSAAPQLLPYVDAARSTFDVLRRLTTPALAQRTHGDLHLGQALRGIRGWIVIDFEGEPAMPLADRVRLDSPLRDVAGMLRSYDYAAHSILLQADISDDDRAARWADHNRRAFLKGYGDQVSPELLRAYEIDKAVYEVAYESAHRPTWIDIPLHALDLLLVNDG